MPPINQDYMFYPHDQCIEESAAGIGCALDLTTGLAESDTLLDVIQRGAGTGFSFSGPDHQLQ